jgi:hypothetical protein
MSRGRVICSRWPTQKGDQRSFFLSIERNANCDKSQLGNPSTLYLGLPVPGLSGHGFCAGGGTRSEPLLVNRKFGSLIAGDPMSDSLLFEKDPGISGLGGGVQRCSHANSQYSQRDHKLYQGKAHIWFVSGDGACHRSGSIFKSNTPNGLADNRH